MTGQKVKQFQIRSAQPKDAEPSTEAFESVYDNYPFPDYTEPERFVENVIEDENADVYVIETEDGVVGTGSVKSVGPGLKELGSTVIHSDEHGLKNENNVSAYHELTQHRLNQAYKNGADIVFTQPVSSTHAKTQHFFNKNDWAVTGVSDKKYCEVFPGENRETVIPMIHTGADFEYVDSNELDVYFDEDLANMVSQSLGNLNSHRDSENKLSRNLVSTEDSEYSSFTGNVSVERAADQELVNFASYEVTPNGNTSLEEFQDMVYEDIQNEDIEWIGVDLDANHEMAGAASEELLKMGFDPEKYEPETLRYDGKVRDKLSLQYRPDATNEIQLVDSALEMAQVMDLDYENTDRETGSPHSTYVRL